MNLSEGLEFVLETAESGRVGAAMEILKRIKQSVDDRSGMVGLFLNQDKKEFLAEMQEIAQWEMLNVGRPPKSKMLDGDLIA